MFIFVAIKRYRSDNESCEGTNTEDPDVDFEQLVNQSEDEEHEDWGLTPELKRMVEQEEMTKRIKDGLLIKGKELN